MARNDIGTTSTRRIGSGRTSSTGRTVVSSDRTRRAIAKRLMARTSAMTTATLEEMGRRHSWFRDLSAEERSWISIVARSGIDGFVQWFADDDAEPYSPTDVFDVAPRSMTRKISLHQTVELVRTTIDVVEAQIETEMPRGDRQVLRTAIVHYSREVAFAAAEVYARAAERRGTWMNVWNPSSLMPSCEPTPMNSSSRELLLSAGARASTSASLSGGPRRPSMNSTCCDVMENACR